MATTTTKTKTKARTAARSTTATGSYRFDVRQFFRMQAAGVFGDDKVELVAGKVYEMTDQPPHTIAVARFRRGVEALFPLDAWDVRQEAPILIGRYWAPKPDLSVLRGKDSTYARRLPRARDVVLLAEVSDTTYHRDRGPKWRRYVASGIPVYLIVRLKGSETVVEVWTEPTGRGRSARYATVVRYAAEAGESVPIEVDGVERGRIAVADLFAR